MVSHVRRCTTGADALSHLIRPRIQTGVVTHSGEERDFARILALLEAGSVSPEQIAILAERHGLSDAWTRFNTRFLDE